MSGVRSLRILTVRQVPKSLRPKSEFAGQVRAGE
jgi:hypothetical protein